MGEASKYDLDPADEKAIAAEQVATFKRERAGHKLNIVRLKAATPVDETDEKAIADAIEKAEADIATIESAIDATQSHHDSLKAPAAKSSRPRR